MKIYSIMILLVGFFIACDPPANQNHLADWAGQPVNLDHLKTERDSFIMVNPSGDKVGGMIWEKHRNGNRYVHNDVSYFDDGSVYEEASFLFSLDPLTIDSIITDMKTPAATMSIRFGMQGKRISGPVQMKRDTNARMIAVDSVLQFDMAREEIYSLIHCLQLESFKEMKLKVLNPLGLAIADASIKFVGKESLTTNYGSYETFKLDLNGGGIIPDNIIWIQDKPRKIIKVKVREPELEIVLAKTSSLD